MTLPARAEVAVVGAGLAGLNAARELVRAGMDVVVVEGAGDIGGRVATDEVDGYLLDRGFQLYNPAYPEGSRVLDHDRLGLRGFGRGVTVVGEGKPLTVVDPRSDPRLVAGLARVPGGPLAGARFARYAAECAYLSSERIKHRPDAPIGEVLDQQIRSRRFTDELVRPFLAGVFGEWELATSRRYADLVLRSFVRGTPSLPADGMGAIPRQLAADVGPDRIHCNTPVSAVADDRVVTTAGAIRADQVIVATDGTTAAGLVTGVPAPSWNALTTWYYAADLNDFGADPRFLVVDGRRRGPLVNVAAVSAVAPTYSRGRLLIAASAVGRFTDDGAARTHLGVMFGRRTQRWDLIARYEIPHALPRFPVGSSLRARQDFDGVLVAGDHRDTPSIQGALASGRRAAGSVLSRMGGRAASA